MRRIMAGLQPVLSELLDRGCCSVRPGLRQLMHQQSTHNAVRSKQVGERLMGDALTEGTGRHMHGGLRPRRIVFLHQSVDNHMAFFRRQFIRRFSARRVGWLLAVLPP